MKRTLLLFVILLVLAGLGLAGCRQEQAPDKLILLDWTGYDDERYWFDFRTKHPDLPVETSYFAEDAEAFAKAKSGFEFDLVHPCNNYYQLWVDNGLIQPIDTSRLENWASVNPVLAQVGQINGEQYYVPFDWGYESILVRTDLVAEVPNSWMDLWDPQYAGHVALYDNGESTMLWVALGLGFDPWNLTPEQVEQVKEKLIEIKPNLLTYWTDYTEVNQLVAAGDVWIAANVWNDGYTTLKGEGIAVDYITPEEGRLGWYCGYAISSNTKNLDAAYDYLNALLNPESQAVFANDFAYGVSNMDAVPLINPDYVEAMNLDDPKALENSVLYRPLTEAQREMFTKTWDEIKAAP